MKLNLDKIHPEKAKRITMLVSEIDDLRWDLKQYARSARDTIRNKESQIKELLDEIDQGELFDKQADQE